MDKLPPEEQSMLPPQALVGLALGGALVSLTAFATGAAAVIVWGGLGIALLALLGWALMAPQQARAVLTGRTLRFGGTSLIATVLLLAALVALYTLIRGANLSLNLSESSEFALSSEGREAIAAIGADPTLPQLQIVAFISASQAGFRDRLEILLEEYRALGQGKIRLEYVDLDRNPLRAEQLGASSPNQLYVARLLDDGTLDIENGELLRTFSQDGLTNAVLRNAAAGDFRAWFIEVADGVGMNDSGPEGMSTLSLALEQQLNWRNRELPLRDFTSPGTSLRLNDPLADGEVMIIAGGSAPLSAPELEVLTGYLDGGGKLLLLAAPGLESGSVPLAADTALGDWLYEHFGLRFRNDMVIDQSQAFQTPLYPVSTDMSASHYITETYSWSGALLFEAPHSIEIAAEPPPEVTVEVLASSSPDARSMTDFDTILAGNIEPGESDPPGPHVLAAVAENSASGARVALFGSSSIIANGFANINGVNNREAAFNSLFWATDFEDYFTRVNIQSAARPQDAPIFTTPQTGALINLITSLLLPFGLLAIGALVWWNRRERALPGGK